MMFYFIATLGCQMNKSDSERISWFLDSLGWQKTFNEKEADFLLVNTCSVRQTAEDRVFGLIRKWKKFKEFNPKLIIGITGCLAGRDKNGKMRAKFSGADLFFPIIDLIKLPNLLKEINPDLNYSIEMPTDYLKLESNYEKKFQAFVPIQTGCNQFCSYCVVPYARGREINRSVSDILKEIKKLAKNGCKEVTLLGQIVNHYFASDPENFSKNNIYKKNDFAKLLWEINQIKGIERIHWTAPHPLFMDDEVIDALTLPKQVNFIHLPVQSGNNEILQKMNRKHNRDFYLEIIKKIKNKKPDIAIGTDIIVGFGGETEDQFNDTVDLYKICEFDISYHAQYSPRSGTNAIKVFPDTVSREEKKRRWETLQTLMEKITLQKNQKYKNKIVEVLIERCLNNKECQGNSREMKLVSFAGDDSLVGKIVKVKIIKPECWILWGEMV